MADTADVRFSRSWRLEVQGQGAPAGSASGDDPLPAPQMPSSHRVRGLFDGATRAVHDVTSHGPPHSLSERTEEDEFVIGTEPSSVLQYFMSPETSVELRYSAVYIFGGFPSPF